MQHLQEQFGRPMSAAVLARYLGVDAHTVRKHHQKWGGVFVGEKRIVFFEKIVARKILEASSLKPDCQAVNKKGFVKTSSVKMVVEDIHGLLPE
jgi:hypothetical protein